MQSQKLPICECMIWVCRTSQYQTNIVSMTYLVTGQRGLSFMYATAQLRIPISYTAARLCLRHRRISALNQPSKSRASCGLNPPHPNPHSYPPARARLHHPTDVDCVQPDAVRAATASSCPCAPVPCVCRKPLDLAQPQSPPSSQQQQHRQPRRHWPFIGMAAA